MAEILAATSGVAGLLTLTIEVFKISKIYVEGVCGAPNAVAAILSELRSLKQILLELDDLYTDVDYGSAIPQLRLINDQGQLLNFIQWLGQSTIYVLGLSCWMIMLRILSHRLAWLMHLLIYSSCLHLI